MGICALFFTSVGMPLVFPHNMLRCWFSIVLTEFLSLFERWMHFHCCLKILLVFRKVCIFDLVVPFIVIPFILPLIFPFLKHILFGLSVLNGIL